MNYFQMLYSIKRALSAGNSSHEYVLLFTHLCSRALAEFIISMYYTFDKLESNPLNAESTFVQTEKAVKNFENHLNPVRLVFIR